MFDAESLEMITKVNSLEQMKTIPTDGIKYWKQEKKIKKSVCSDLRRHSVYKNIFINKFEITTYIYTLKLNE